MLTNYTEVPVLPRVPISHNYFIMCGIRGLLFRYMGLEDGF